MNIQEPVYKSTTTPYIHTYKDGYKKESLVFAATLVGFVNGVPIAEKTEIVNAPFSEEIEKKRLYERYEKKLQKELLYQK